MLKTQRAEMKIKCEDFIEVYCKCRMPEIVGVDMVQCGKCSEWFHVHCVNVPSEVMEESNVDWFCYLCVKANFFVCPFISILVLTMNTLTVCNSIGGVQIFQWGTNFS